MPFYEVAYGHVVRYSKASSESHASVDAFGMIDIQRMTVKSLPKNPAYMTVKLKRECQQKLALRHFRKTGSILSGWENEPGIKNVHWTRCPKCKIPVITEPAASGVDDRLCNMCDPDYGPKDL